MVLGKFEVNLKMENLTKQEYKVNRNYRNKTNKHQSFVIWFTGLSGSGKSTLANLLEQKLQQKGIKSYVLDGDNVRMGLNNDLNFTDEGRKENIRRVAEVAKLMVDAGLVVITSFISPFIEDRTIAKKIIGDEDFVEVYIKCPLEVCEKRDVKGLYSKARNGEIKHFTGIDSPYEIPTEPFITINTENTDSGNCVDEILNSLIARFSKTIN
jgi:adenylylsulfate kinase